MLRSYEARHETWTHPPSSTEPNPLHPISFAQMLRCAYTCHPKLLATDTREWSPSGKNWRFIPLLHVFRSYSDAQYRPLLCVWTHCYLTWCFSDRASWIDYISEAYPGIFFRGAGSTNSVEDRENGDLGVVAP